MANEQTNKFDGASGSKRIIVGIAAGLLFIIALVFLVKGSVDDDEGAKSSVKTAPDVASVPGVGSSSAEYVKAQELANIELAKQGASQLLKVLCLQLLERS